MTSDSCISLYGESFDDDDDDGLTVQDPDNTTSASL